MGVQGWSPSYAMPTIVNPAWPKGNVDDLHGTRLLHVRYRRPAPHAWQYVRDVTSEESDRTFLEFLARDAPSAEFEEPIIADRALGASAETVAALERSILLALRVRAALDRSRRREAELSALYETVGDLVALRDVDAVLEAIVRRARKLLDTDTAYLALYDPERGHAYVRETNGSVSAEFQHLLMPLGAGLGGLVVQTASPLLQQ